MSNGQPPPGAPGASAPVSDGSGHPCILVLAPPDLGGLVQSLLVFHHFDVLRTHAPAVAGVTALERPLDLAILDLELCAGEGSGILETLVHTVGIPVVVIGLGPLDHLGPELRARAERARAYVQKPLHARRLLDTVQRILKGDAPDDPEELDVSLGDDDDAVAPGPEPVLQAPTVSIPSPEPLADGETPEPPSAMSDAPGQPEPELLPEPPTAAPVAAGGEVVATGLFRDPSAAVTVVPTGESFEPELLPEPGEAPAAALPDDSFEPELLPEPGEAPAAAFPAQSVAQQGHAEGGEQQDAALPEQSPAPESHAEAGEAHAAAAWRDSFEPELLPDTSEAPAAVPGRDSFEPELLPEPGAVLPPEPEASAPVPEELLQPPSLPPLSMPPAPDFFDPQPVPEPDEPSADGAVEDVAAPEPSPVPPPAEARPDSPSVPDLLGDAAGLDLATGTEPPDFLGAEDGLTEELLPSPEPPSLGPVSAPPAVEATPDAEDEELPPEAPTLVSPPPPEAFEPELLPEPVPAPQHGAEEHAPPDAAQELPAPAPERASLPPLGVPEEDPAQLPAQVPADAVTVPDATAPAVRVAVPALPEAPGLATAAVLAQVDGVPAAPDPTDVMASWLRQARDAPSPDRGPSPTALPAAEGILDSGTLADLLGAFQANRLTGLLVVQDGTVTRRLGIRDGKLESATSNLPDELLTSLSHVTEVDDAVVMEGLRTLEGKAARLLQHLAQQGQLTPEQVVAVLEHYRARVVRESFGARHARYQFTLGQVPASALTPLDMGRVILRGTMGSTSEDTLREHHRPTLRLVLRQHRQDVLERLALDPRERVVVSALDGTKTVADLLALADLHELHVLGLLEGLGRLGLLEALPDVPASKRKMLFF